MRILKKKSIRLGNRKNIVYQFCGFTLTFFCITKILIMLRQQPVRFAVHKLTLAHVFCALNKNKLKPHLLVPYLFPAPLTIVLLGLTLINLACQTKPLKTPQKTSISPRIVKDNVLTSTQLPDIEIAVDQNFKFIGNFDFEITAISEEWPKEVIGKPIAAGERFVFVEADDKKGINKLFIVQFEGFLPQYNFTYNYSFNQAELLGNRKFRHNTWFYDNEKQTAENPKNEGAKTKRFLEAKGYQLEPEFMMSRFLALASEDRKNELIIYYVEMLHNRTGYSLTEWENTLEKSEKKAIRDALIERSRKSFTIL